MSDNKFSTERTQSNTQDAAAAEELEREAKTGNDVTTYTHCFSSPFTFHSITEDVIKDTTVDTLTRRKHPHCKPNPNPLSLPSWRRPTAPSPRWR